VIEDSNLGRAYQSSAIISHYLGRVSWTTEPEMAPTNLFQKGSIYRPKAIGNDEYIRVPRSPRESLITLCQWGTIGFQLYVLPFVISITPLAIIEPDRVARGILNGLRVYYQPPLRTNSKGSYEWTPSFTIIRFSKIYILEDLLSSYALNYSCIRCNNALYKRFLFCCHRCR
jgi:hypothetical protein